MIQPDALGRTRGGCGFEGQPEGGRGKNISSTPQLNLTFLKQFDNFPALSFIELLRNNVYNIDLYHCGRRGVCEILVCVAA